MKKLLLALSFVIMAGFAVGQNSSSDRASNYYYSPKTQLNLGVGLSGWGIPVYLGLDFGVSRDVTLGGEISFRA